MLLQDLHLVCEGPNNLTGTYTAAAHAAASTLWEPQCIVILKLRYVECADADNQASNGQGLTSSM